MQISHLNSNSIRRRKAKTATLTLTLYSGGEKKEENNRRRKVSFFWSRRKRGKIFGEDLSKNCQGYWEVLVSVSVSRLLPIFGGFRIQRIWSPKKFRFGFPKIWSQKKSTGFGEFGLGKKVPVLVLENLVSAKKSRFRKIWYRKKSLGIGFGKFGIGKKVSVSVSVKILVSSFTAVRAVFSNQLKLFTFDLNNESFYHIQHPKKLLLSSWMRPLSV